MRKLKLAKATLIAPLAGPVVYFLVASLLSISRNDLDVASVVLHISVGLFGIVISYAVTLTLGLPIVLILKWMGRLSTTSLVLAGLLLGATLFPLMSQMITNPVFDSVFSIQFIQVSSIGGIVGAVIAYTFSWISGLKASNEDKH